MNRNRFLNYRARNLKYTFKFMIAGFETVLLDRRYTIVAIILLFVETTIFGHCYKKIRAMDLWIDMRRPYTFFLIIVLAVAFLFAITEIGRPKGFRKIMREMEKIPRILNGDNEAPVLISRKKNNDGKTERWVFDSYGRPYSYFKELQKEIESALDVGIIRIIEGRDGHKVAIDLTFHPGPWPQMVPWNDNNLEADYSKLPLGVNRLETVFLNLTETAHAIINGRTGSGKTIAMKSLCYGAIMKGYEVYLVDFKGGVDYGPIWENHCTLICDNIEFITVIQGLVDELKKRFEYLRQFGHANIDDFNSKVTFAPMRRIILFVDELGECLDKSGMTKEQKETVDQITQGLNTLCRLGRAAGISCILSTQRGSADLISGQIRNNALKIVGKCDENLSLLTIGITDAAKELIYPGQFMDENGNVFQGYYADYTDLLRQRREKGTIGCYAIKRQPIHFLDEKVIEVLEDGTES